MKEYQRIIIVLIAIFMLFGAIIIFALGGDFLWILFYYFIIGVPGAFLYFAFKIPQCPKNISTHFTQKIHPPIYVRSSENRVLFILKTIWPFVFFTDTLIIREKTVTLIDKLFVLSVWSDTFSIKSLTGVYLSTSYFFATLTIVRKDPKIEYQLHFLKKAAAIRAKEILDGLLLVKENLIKVPKNLSTKEEKEVLAEIGQEQDIEEEMKK